MDFELLARFVDILATVFVWIVIAASLLSFVIPPYHPVREALDRIVAPFLNPIRRMMPSTGTLDFSPMILIFVVWAIQWLVTSILRSI